MSNTVTLTASWNDGNGNVGTGNYEVIPGGSGIESGTVMFSSPEVSGQLDDTGSFSVTLRASDDFAFGVLNYSFKIIVEGIENVIASNVPVNFTPGGSAQGLFAVLSAAGWSPDTPANF
jgi:hypothetical protein